MDTVTSTDALYWSSPLGELPPEAKPFSTERTVRTGDVDPAQRLRLDGVARYLQDIGIDNLAAVDAMETDPLWIVRRTVVDVLRPARFPQKLRLQRWCDALSTRWANVRVRIDGAPTDDSDPDEPGPLIETAAFWIDINPTSGTPARISDTLFAHMSMHATDTRLKWRAWLPPTPPDGSATIETREFPLRVTDFDPFGHVNNAAYWHGVEELLAARPDLQTAPYRAVIEHLRPVVTGDTLVLRAHAEPDSLRIWFTVDDEVRAVAKVGPR